MTKNERIPVVTVPARNEEATLPALFDSLAAQDWHADRAAPLDVVVVLNNCSDGSRDAVERAAARYSTLAIALVDVQLPDAEAHVGTARRMAMDAAFERASPEHLAVLTTDADSAPRPDWVTANLRHLADGIDLVCGYAVIERSEYDRMDGRLKARGELGFAYQEAIEELTALIDPSPHDPWPRHSDQTGQSLAIRGETYRAVGGLPPLSCQEDFALVRRVLAEGLRVRHPLDVVVETSARLEGRAAGGMAEALRHRLHDAASGAPLLVEHPRRVRQRLTGTTSSIVDGLAPIPVHAALTMLRRMIVEASNPESRVA